MKIRYENKSPASMAECLSVLLAQDLCTRCLPCSFTLPPHPTQLPPSRSFLSPLPKLLSCCLTTQCPPPHEFLDIFPVHLCAHPLSMRASMFCACESLCANALDDVGECSTFTDGCWDDKATQNRAIWSSLCFMPLLQET